MEHARRRASLIHPDSHGLIGPRSPVCACFGLQNSQANLLEIDNKKELNVR